MEDQWKLDGDCEKCRRQKYCGSECKPRKTVRKKAVFMDWAKNTKEGQEFTEAVWNAYTGSDLNEKPEQTFEEADRYQKTEEGTCG